VASAATTKEIATVAKDTPKADMTPAAARELTAKIRASVDTTVELIRQAIGGRIWLAMHDSEGNPYKDWNAYSRAELGGFKLSLSRQDRPAVVEKLYNAGASQNMIASITGTTRQTVSNDIKRVESQRVAEEQEVNNLPPDDENITDTTAEDLPEDLPANGKPLTSIGGDGKEYKRGKATATPKAKTPDVVDVAKKIGAKLDKLISEIDDLYDLPGARDAQMGTILATHVSYFIDAATKYNLMPAEVAEVVS
jgi:predicted transcriptional regulator